MRTPGPSSFVLAIPIATRCLASSLLSSSASLRPGPSIVAAAASDSYLHGPEEGLPTVTLSSRFCEWASRDGMIMMDDRPPIMIMIMIMMSIMIASMMERRSSIMVLGGGAAGRGDREG